MNGTASHLSLDELIGELAEEYADRIRRGETPSVDEYVRQYPHAAVEIRRIFPALEVIAESPPAREERSEPNPSPPQNGTLGDYRLLREIGRGGMGVVYEAEQISLGRHVALKILPFAAVLDPRQIQRFKNEALAAAQLDHPHIVDVYGVGCERSVHFYAMRYVEGETLASVIAELRRSEGPAGELSHGALAMNSVGNGQSADHLAATILQNRGSTTPEHAAQKRTAEEGNGRETTPVGKLTTENSIRSREFFRSAARIGVEIATALDHAHQQGVIHRDVKPSNLLIDAAGKSWITDFGLARVGDASLTMTGDLLGTLRYMSPEQALAKRVVVDHRTDVYSLGVTLYELLTLQPAFPQEDRQELLRRISFEEPVRPRKLNPHLPPDLETVVLKASSKNPDERYATAAEMAEDLQRYLNDEPIRARRPTLLQRLVKWSRRHRALVSAGILCLAIAAVVSTVAASLIWNENRKTQEALSEKTAALGDKDAALREKRDALAREQAQAYRHRVGFAEHKFRENDLPQVEKLLAECPSELRHFGWHYLNRLCRSEVLDVKHGVAGGILDVAVAADRVSIAGGVGRAAIVDLATSRIRWNSSKTGNVHRWSAAAFEPSGTTIAVVSDLRLTVRDAATGTVLQRLDAPGTKYLRSLCFVAGGRLAAVARIPDPMVSFGIDVWDVQQAKLLRRIPLDEGDIRQLFADPTGSRLFLSVFANQIRVFDISSEARAGAKPATLEGHRIAFHPDGKRMAVAAGTQPTSDVIRIVQIADGKVPQTISGELGRISDLAFSPDGKRLVSCGSDRTVRLWETATGRLQSIYRGHFEAVQRVAFNADGSRITSAGETELKVWDATRDQRFLSIKAAAKGVDFAPNGRFVAIGSLALQVGAWDAGSGRKIWNKRLAHRNSVWDVAVSPDSRLIASAGFDDDNTVKIWNAASGSLLHTLKGHVRGIQTVAFSPRGNLLASAGIDRTIRLWNPQTGKLVRVLKGHSRSIAGVTFSPDGKYLASLAGGLYHVHSYPWPKPKFDDGGQPYEIRVWEVEDGDVLFTHNPPLQQAFQPAFSPDGNTLAVPCHDGKVRLYAVPSGRLQGMLSDIGIAHCVTYTPDGKRLAVGWFDGRIGLWDPVAREKVVDLRGELRMVSSIAFSGDGRRLASCSMAGSRRGVTIWDATPPPEATMRSTSRKR